MPCTSIQVFLISYCWQADDILKPLYIKCGCHHEVLMNIYMSTQQPIANISLCW